jgi:hypothetical protein
MSRCDEFFVTTAWFKFGTTGEACWDGGGRVTVPFVLPASGDVTVPFDLG